MCFGRKETHVIVSNAEIMDALLGRTKPQNFLNAAMRSPLIVINAIGTSSEPPQGQSHLEDYRNTMGFVPNHCDVGGCGNPAEVGAHVGINMLYPAGLYIAAFCYRHNNQHGATFMLKANARLCPVSAIRSNNLLVPI